MPSASATPASIARTCSACHKTVRVGSQLVGVAVKCPSCGEAIKPGSEETSPAPLVAAAGAAVVSRVVGWPISVALHVIVLTVAVFIASPQEETIGSGGQEVGIVGVGEQQNIEAGDAKLVQIQSGSPKVQAVNVAMANQVQPLPNLHVGGAQSVEPLIGIGAGGGGSDGMAGDWSAFGAGGGQGGGGASFFGLGAKGRKFVFVVDRSTSMTGAKLTAAKQELFRSVRSLKSNMKFYIIFYSNSHTPMQARDLVRATSAQKRQYLAWVEGVQAQGGTEPASAMKLALSLKPDAIWLLSDGLFNDGVCDVIRQANPGAKVQVHTLAFYDNAGERVLMRIAEENRGKYQFVAQPGMGRP